MAKVPTLYRRSGFYLCPLACTVPSPRQEVLVAYGAVGGQTIFYALTGTV
jgi:hypothetical protein